MQEKITKIAYIVSSRMPTEKAHGFQIAHMCESFADRGADVELVAPERRNSVEQDIFSYCGVKRNFAFREIRSLELLTDLPFLSRASFHAQNLLFFLRLFFLPLCRQAIIYTRIPAVVWIGKIRGRKTIYECHDWLGKGKRLSLFFLRRADRIIATNRFIKEQFVQNGFSEKHILVAPNGVDLERFTLPVSKEEACEKLNIHTSKKILLYTGSFRTMDQEKGIDDILRALALLPEQVRQNIVFFAVGGNNRDISFYSKRAKDLGVSESVKFFEKETQEKLALFQKAADILLMPFPHISHYEYFMSPLKTFEYMASGRPIIASDLPSIREILNEKNALFCKPGDPSDLAQKIADILEGASLGTALAGQALIDVREFTWKNRAEKILAFLSRTV